MVAASTRSASATARSPSVVSTHVPSSGSLNRRCRIASSSSTRGRQQPTAGAGLGERTPVPGWAGRGPAISKRATPPARSKAMFTYAPRSPVSSITVDPAERRELDPRGVRRPERGRRPALGGTAPTGRTASGGRSRRPGPTPAPGRPSSPRSAWRTRRRGPAHAPLVDEPRQPARSGSTVAVQRPLKHVLRTFLVDWRLGHGASRCGRSEAIET